MPIKDLSTEQLLVEMREIHAAMMKHSRLAIMESSRLSRFQAELERRAEAIKAFEARVARSAGNQPNPEWTAERSFMASQWFGVDPAPEGPGGIKGEALDTSFTR